MTTLIDRIETRPTTASTTTAVRWDPDRLVTPALAGSHYPLRELHSLDGQWFDPAGVDNTVKMWDPGHLYDGYTPTVRPLVRALSPGNAVVPPESCGRRPGAYPRSLVPTAILASAGPGSRRPPHSFLNISATFFSYSSCHSGARRQSQSS